jgi:hypothetical protein
MSVVVATGMTVSTLTTVKTANLVSGTYEFIGKGKLTLAARGSAAGMYATLTVGGVSIVNDQNLPYIGTTGGLSVNDHIVCSQTVNGGRIEFYLRNSTGGTLTTDYILLFDPM